MSETLVSKALKRAGVDPAATRGMEISELFDADQHAAAEAALAADAATYAQSLPEENDLVEFYTPFDEEYREWFMTGNGRGSLIPGIRFPKLGTIAEQDIGSYFTIPANIASERVRLGGPLVDFEPERVKPEEVLAVLEKYNIATNERVIGKLVEATSPEDLEARATIYARRQQREEQIAVDNPGLLGFGTRVLTNVLDPALLVTGGIASAGLTVKLANSATKTGAAMRFAADGLTKGERFRVGAMTALAVDIPLEGVRATVDPNQDLLMTAGFLALTPLLGGALNSIGRNKADDLAEAAQALDKALADGINGTNSGAVGAAQSGPVPKTFPEEDLPGAPPKAGRFTIGTPLNYLARSSDSLVRSLADKLSWNPNTRSTQGTTAAEAQRRIYNAQAVRMRAGRMAAKEFFKTKGFQPTTEQLDDFFRQVGQHISGARVSTDPAILRAVEAYREGFADMLAYVRDKDHVTGRTRPGPYVPPAAPPAASSAAPNAPTPPPAAPAGGPPVAPVAAPGPTTREATAAPEAIAETPAVPDTGASAPDATGINPEAPRGTSRDYFGRKSFRSGAAEAAPAPEKVAAEAAPSGPPSRTDLRRSLQSFADAAEALGEEATEELKAALAQAQRYLAGASMGSGQVFQRKYLDALKRLAEALEEAPDGSAASKLMADIVEDLDSGLGSRIADDGPMLARRGSPDAAASFETPGSPEYKAALAKGLDMSYAARAARATELGFAEPTFHHANTGGIKGEGFDNSKLPPGDPDAPFVAHWFSNEPSEFNAYPVTGNASTPVRLRLTKAAPISVVRELQKTFRGQALREELARQGYTHSVWRGRDPIDWDAFDSTGLFTYRTSRGDLRTIQRDANSTDTEEFINLYSGETPSEGNLITGYGDRVDFGEQNPEVEAIAVFDPKDIRSVNAAFDPANADSANLLAKRPDRDDFAANEVALQENAKAYDAFLAEVQYTGKGKRPIAAKDAAAMATVLGTGAAAAGLLADADEDTIAGLGIFGAAVGLAFGVASGRARVRTWERKTPGIGVFLGAESPGADLKALKKAEALEAKGADRDLIWKETGWGRDPEGRWMWEADQPLGELVDDLIDGPIKFGKAFRAGDLIKAEPDLLKVVLQVRSLTAQLVANGWEGAALPDQLKASVNPSLSRPQRLRVMLHEVNHLLQAKRRMTVPDGSATDARVSAEAARAEGLYKDLVAMIERGEVGPEFDRLSAELADAERGMDEFYQYSTMSVEADSRLVEKRLGYSRDQRRATPPWKDFDVPEDDVWAGKGAAVAASLGSDLKLFRSDEFWDNNVETGEFADGEVQGYVYSKVGTGPNAIYAWVEEAGDGEGIINWDWAKNVEGNTLFADNLDASPSDSARAFAFAQVATERVLKSGEFDLVTFEGLKKAAPGRTASGHERMQKALMARGQSDGYVPTMGSWKTKVKDPQTGEMVEAIRSSFAFVREGMDVAEAWQNIRRGKVDIEVIEKKVQGSDNVAAKRGTPGGPDQRDPADTYRGLEEWRDIEEDPAYLPRRYNKQGWDRVFNSAKFRGNTNAVGNAIGNTLYRSNQQRFDELGERLGIQGLEAAWRVGRKYAETVSILMNPAENGRNPFRKVTPDDREAAKEIVRDIVNAGESLGDDAEEAMEMLLDLVAPVKKKNAESARARPRLEMNLDAELDADIIDMFEWNVESLFTAYARNLSGYAGLLKAGFNSAAELDSQIDEVRRTTRAMGAEPQKRAAKEAEKLQLLRDAILGVPPEEMMKSPVWNWTANQLRRLNFGNLMNNTGFLAVSELGAALTQVNAVRMMSMFPAYQRYIKQARAGDPAAVSNIYYLADVTMGHGSAQVRSRIGDMAERADMAAPSLADRPQGAMDKIDRFTRKQANLVGRFSGMSPIQEFLRMTIVTAEAQDWVKAARKGRPLYSARRMAALGVDAAMWQRISGQLRKWGDITSPDSQQQVPNMALDVWDDAEALNAWINALDRNANRLVMEGDVGHQAFWLRNRPSNQLLFQFLNFPMNAFSKHLGFALNVQDARVGQEMLAMSIGGMAGYYARVYAQAYSQDTEEEREAFIAERATAAEASKAFFYYGAHYSLAPNAVDFALFLGKSMNVPNPIPGYDGETVSPLFSKTRGSGLPGDPFTGNPTYSRASRAPGVIGENFTGTKFSEQDVQGLVKHFAPLGNHIALNAFLDRALEFLPDEEGSVEDQVQ